MSIECKFPVRVLSQDEFHAIDRTVMRHAFDIQNELGCFYDELVYQNELIFRCRGAGLGVLPEARIDALHMDFKKPYYLDMLVENGAVYELKTVDSLAGMHETQLINYLLLSGLHHGKLINFRPASVEHHFVSTQITAAVRHNIQFDENDWTETSPEDRLTLKLVHTLLADWGSFLDVTLYEEALLHFLGGSERRTCALDVCVDGRVVGTQKARLLREDAALHVSSVKRHHSSYQKHLERLFKHTKLTQIQWINFNQNKVEMVTLKK